MINVEEDKRYPDCPLLFADGFDSCIIGVVEQACVGPRVCYDAELCIERLMDMMDCDYSEAADWFYTNTAGGYEGEYTPMFLFKQYGEGEDLIREMIAEHYS